MRTTDMIGGIVAVAALSMLFVGINCLANEIDLETNLRIGITPQLAMESAIDLVGRFGLAAITGTTHIGVWPAFYASGSLDFEYLLGRFSSHAGAQTFLDPFLFDYVSIGADYALFDWQNTENSLQRFAMSAGADILWNPYSGFGIVPRVQAWVWMVPTDCYFALELNDGAALSLQTDWPIFDWMGLTVGADIAIGKAGIDFDIILGLVAQIELSVGKLEAPSVPSAEEDVPLDDVIANLETPGGTASVDSPAALEVNEEAEGDLHEGHDPCYKVKSWSATALVTAETNYATWLPGKNWRMKAVERGKEKALEMAQLQLERMREDMELKATELAGFCHEGCEASVTMTDPTWPPRFEVAEYSPGKLRVTAIFSCDVTATCHSP